MIRTSASSQVLALLPQNNLPKCLRLPQQIKPLLPLWKFQQILAKMLAKGKKLKLPRARIRTKIRVKARPQTPLFLSPSKLLIQEHPRHKLRTLVLVVHLFSLFTASVLFLLKKCTSLLLSMKICLFCFISHDKECRTVLMSFFFNLNCMYGYIRQIKHIRRLVQLKRFRTQVNA